MKLTISRKLLLGYLFMALLTVTAGAYALFNLQKLYQVAYDITAHRFVLLEQSKKLADALVAQESAERRFLILKDPVLEDIFNQRSGEFQAALEKVRRLPVTDTTAQAIDEIDQFHKRLKDLFNEEGRLIRDGRDAEARELSDTASRQSIEAIAKLLRAIQATTDKEINEQMNLVAGQGRTAVNLTLGLGLSSLLLGIVLALLITRSISKPIKQLQQATAMIADGRLDHRIEARRDDEIGALAKSFAHMTQRLRELEALHLDASPLTGLPGNLAIENRINYLLGQKKKFALCQVDLDNFKPFADKYGYAWGSEVIKEVAAVLSGYIHENPATGLFLGHIGGDDYVLIGDPFEVESVCRKLVADFQNRIRRFYSDQDAANGYFIGRDRHGIIREFPLVTVTAALVVDDGTRFADALTMGRAVAELKEYAKTLPGSNYVTEDDVVNHRLAMSNAEQKTLDLEDAL
ncbi:MAG TPA: HAMP domain-containing protein [Smithellaceae bacterium]|nr:HAMP domain-containing protein [Smithellaceae bacterium]